MKTFIKDEICHEGAVNISNTVEVTGEVPATGSKINKHFSTVLSHYILGSETHERFKVIKANQ